MKAILFGLLLVGLAVGAASAGLTDYAPEAKTACTETSAYAYARSMEGGRTSANMGGEVHSSGSRIEETEPGSRVYEAEQWANGTGGGNAYAEVPGAPPSKCNDPGTIHCDVNMDLWGCCDPIEVHPVQHVLCVVNRATEDLDDFDPNIEEYEDYIFQVLYELLDDAYKQLPEDLPGPEDVLQHVPPVVIGCSSSYATSSTYLAGVLVTNPDTLELSFIGVQASGGQEELVMMPFDGTMPDFSRSQSASIDKARIRGVYSLNLDPEKGCSAVFGGLEGLQA